MIGRVTAGTLVAALALGVAGCPDNTVEIDTEPAGCAEAVELAECENLAGLDLAGRCEAVFPGSAPCLYIRGTEVCAEYPPLGGAFVSTAPCDDREVETWCCK